MISGEELGVALRSLGQYWTEADLEQLRGEIRGRTLSFDDFVSIVMRRARQEPNFDDVLKAFKVFDREEKGEVSVEELRHVLTTMGERITEQEFDEIMRANNIDPKGVIEYHDFVKMLKAN
uniref:Calmodulin n=1 Tax=Chromera velia CCMP2878 TaxID=1169474 RepID=A0A0G4GR41_9ALVE|eukprot:Cvel_23009.t1-p1 / transcript=Cvel_23009.t1 / gene=Cvel_23009 / organism=Chromera_velia_CCMP2878 / gene_product=Calmodulin, putative / transcript_product=Calmodulin, putative / location=Cvel_scaffold2323:3261-4896(-) / protein_length=120 / sequence_SO=supercontig / SO=protein_coding / is_pseudo=false